MSVKSAVYSILSGDPALSGIVGDRIYPTVAPSSAVAPYVTYHVISDNALHTISGVTPLTKYRLQFSCYSFDSITNTNVVEAIKSLLDVKTISGAGFSLTSYEDNNIDSDEAPQDASEQYTYTSNLDYLVWFRTE